MPDNKDSEALKAMFRKGKEEAIDLDDGIEYSNKFIKVK